MSAYADGVATIATDAMLQGSTWGDLGEAIAEFADGWGMSADTVGDDVLAAMSTYYRAAVLAAYPSVLDHGEQA